jgi:hypothetical protein
MQKKNTRKLSENRKPTAKKRILATDIRAVFDNVLTLALTATADSYFSDHGKPSLD